MINPIYMKTDFPIIKKIVRNFDDIARSEIANFRDGFRCFVWDIICADMENYMIEIISRNKFHMICHTSKGKDTLWSNSFRLLHETQFNAYFFHYI